MENRLQELKKTIDATSFNQLQFTEQHRQKVLAKVRETESGVQLAVMQQLLIEEKTGFQLMQLLQGRGISKFDENEGSLYALLHQWEIAGYLRSSWNEDGKKYYKLNEKGKKLVGKMERQSTSSRISLTWILEG